jgi:hypothetical protein
VAKNQVREHAERRERPTLGSAIDLMIAALYPLDSRSRQTALLAVCHYLGVDLQDVLRIAHRYGLWPVTKNE